jgi:glucosylceramidase
MTPRHATPIGFIAALGALIACSSGVVPPVVATPAPAPAPPADTTRVAVRVWLTTGDQQSLLARQPDVFLLKTASARDTSIATIDVDDARTYQQMIGFGAAMTDASAHLIEELAPTQREALLQDLFGRDTGSTKIGFSFVRVPMGASDFSMRQYSYDDMPAGQTDPTLAHFSTESDRAEKIPLVQRAFAINPQLRLMASPWSPPGWMKSTGSLIKGTLLPRYYDAFAEYFVKFIDAYATAGVPIYAISLQNEPNFEPGDYPGMNLPAAARARVIADHIGPRFAHAGIRTLIWDWDHNWDVPESPLEVLADSGARKYVQGVAWHCYAGDVSAQSKVHDAHPDKDTYFTECSGGEWSPKFADNLKWFVGNLVIGAPRNWARAVAVWNIALDKNFGPHLGGCGNCRGVVTIDTTTGGYTRNVEYYALAHASKFVRSGAYRISSESSDKDVSTIAFKNSARGDTSRVVVVLNGSDRERAVRLNAGARSARLSIPAGSVVTLRWGGR